MKAHNILRAGTTLLASAVLVAGVSFAALRSQNNISSGSRMMSASANLLISMQGDSGYSSYIGGYEFLNLIPGGEAAPAVAHELYFHNQGSADLDLHVSLNPERLILSNGANMQNTHLVIYDEQGNSEMARFSLADLSMAYTNGSPLPLNISIATLDIKRITLRMQLVDALADVTLQQEISNMDFVFSGVAV